MRTIDATLHALEHNQSQLAGLDPSRIEQWQELLGTRQQIIEELLFLLDAPGEPLNRQHAARISTVWSAAEALAERLRVHRALIRHQLAESHRGLFLCQALSGAAPPSNLSCQG